MTDTPAHPTYHFDSKPHLLIIQARACPAVADLQLSGALAVLDQAAATHDVLPVPGVLEIPAAILYAVKALDFDAARRRYDGYVALGCAPTDDLLHDPAFGIEAIHALQDLALHYVLAIGNGILTRATLAQALERADPAKDNQGARAAHDVLRMIEIKQNYRLTPKRRWVAKT